MKKEIFNPLPSEIQAEIDALTVSKEPIRTDLIPEATGDWSDARRGLFYRSPASSIDNIPSEQNSSWFLSLSGEYNTNWGDIDTFYYNIENDPDYSRNSNFIDIKTSINVNSIQGNIKFLNANQKKYPANGDNLAFYHSSRAKKRGAQTNQPQISLVGCIIKATVDNDKIKYLEVRVKQEVFKKFYGFYRQKQPILRKKNRDLFNLYNVIPPGSIYTLYQVPEEFWKELIHAVE